MVGRKTFGIYIPSKKTGCGAGERNQQVMCALRIHEGREGGAHTQTRLRSRIGIKAARSEWGVGSDDRTRYRHPDGPHSAPTEAAVECTHSMGGPMRGTDTNARPHLISTVEGIEKRIGDTPVKTATNCPEIRCAARRTDDGSSGFIGVHLGRVVAVVVVV